MTSLTDSLTLLNIDLNFCTKVGAAVVLGLLEGLRECGLRECGLLDGLGLRECGLREWGLLECGLRECGLRECGLLDGLGLRECLFL